ncbi:MAG: hypothetical protein C6Y22_20340 [Hapalosiphonaceae cyanobacterium JJU2]|nr:MAG: hypothetical protein C6Y22_20340 [Hapalosiphonaceae cyanobacterium JJU2]
MALTWGFLRRTLFGVSLENIDNLWINFPGDSTEAQRHLKQISFTFINGCNAALELGNTDVLVSQLEATKPNLRGFAYEGAGMGLAILDYVSPWRQNRLENFLNSAGAKYSHLVHIGVGFAIVGLQRGIKKSLAPLDPLQRWLAIDGYGFCLGMNHWQHFVKKAIVPKGLTGYACRAFDQGLGRAIWFSLSADITGISEIVNSFPLSRQADLWSGIGFASIYAGEINRDALELLKTSSGKNQLDLAQGGAMAVKCRDVAGNQTSYTALASSILCGMPIEAVVRLVDTTRVELPLDAEDWFENPAYEVWRQRIQFQFNNLLIQNAETVIVDLSHNGVRC